MRSIVAFLLLTAPLTAMAAERGVTGSLSGGAFWFSDDEHLEDTWTVIPRVGWQFQPRHAIELEAGYMQALTEVDRNSFGVTPRLNYLYSPFAENDWRVHPYVAGGPGVIRKDVDRSFEEEDPKNGYGNYINPDVDILLNGGPGLELSLTSRASLRTDLRYVLNLGSEPHGTRADVFNNLEWTAGLWFHPGTGPEDSDADGLVDVDDVCPFDAEDHDGYLDIDGCPDTDNDQDGLSDVEDYCPNRFEDWDGFQDDNGCPDMDNDLDGVIDYQDSCPETAGRGEDGCPEAVEIIEPLASERVWIEDDRLVLAEEIYFALDSATIEARSFHILDDLAAYMAENPELGVIEIAGHADATGPQSYNEALSYQRAGAVYEYLVRSGVDEDMLMIHGYGEALPDATNKDSLGRAWNRRVEFTVLEIADSLSDAQ